MLVLYQELKFKMIRYTLNSFQNKIVNDIKTLNENKLTYAVIQQSNSHKNLTLNELKKYIRRSIRKEVKTNIKPFKKGIEDNYLKYAAIIETRKNFFIAQHTSTSDENVYLGLHFHLFVSPTMFYERLYSSKKFSQILKSELISLKHKKNCLQEFECREINSLDNDFITYHTKQFMFRGEKEFYLTNL